MNGSFEEGESFDFLGITQRLNQHQDKDLLRILSFEYQMLLVSGLFCNGKNFYFIESKYSIFNKSKIHFFRFFIYTEVSKSFKSIIRY